MGNIDQLGSALANGLAIQVGHPILSDDIAHMIAGSDDASAMFEHGRNLGNNRPIAQHVSTGRVNDSHAALRAGSAVDEVHLAANAGVKFGTDAVGAHLAGQVYFDGRIDGDHAVVLRNDEGVVDVFGAV